MRILDFLLLDTMEGDTLPAELVLLMSVSSLSKPMSSAFFIWLLRDAKCLGDKVAKLCSKFVLVLLVTNDEDNEELAEVTAKLVTVLLLLLLAPEDIFKRCAAYFEGEASESEAASPDVTVAEVDAELAVALRVFCRLSRHHCKYDSRAICSSMASLVASQSEFLSLSSNIVCSISNCSLRRAASFVCRSGL